MLEDDEGTCYRILIKDFSGALIMNGHLVLKFPAGKGFYPIPKTGFRSQAEFESAISLLKAAMLTFEEPWFSNLHSRNSSKSP